MSDGIDIDFSDFTRLAADIAEAPDTAKKNIPKALAVTAHKVRDGWRDRLSGSPGLSQVAPTINYDIEKATVFGAGVFTAEIGPDRSKGPAKLANISEFGTPFHPPRGFGLAALQEQVADFEKGLGFAVGDIL